MKRITRLLAAAAMLSLVAAACKKDDTPAAHIAIYLGQNSAMVPAGGTADLLMYWEPQSEEPEFTWTSSDEGVVKIGDIESIRNVKVGTRVYAHAYQATLQGMKTGSAEVKVSHGSASAVCTVSVYNADNAPFDYREAFAQHLSSQLVYSARKELARNYIMQGFDIGASGKMYYSQITNAQGTGTQGYISYAAGPNKSMSGSMILTNFGHFTQIVAEETTDGTFIWMNSNGQVDGDNSSNNNLSFSRVPFVPGGNATNCSGDTFFLNKGDEYDQQVSVDFVNRRLLVGTRSPSKSGRFFWVFDLDEVLALPKKSMTISLKTDSSGKKESRTVEGYDLNDCKVLGNFKLPRGKNADKDPYYYSHQGHEIYGDYIYFYEGNSYDDNGDGFYERSAAYMTCFDYKGNIVIPRTKIVAISDSDLLKSMDLSYDGYAEGESFVIREGVFYIGIGCHYSSGLRRAPVILKYSVPHLK